MKIFLEKWPSLLSPNGHGEGGNWTAAAGHHSSPSRAGAQLTKDLTVFSHGPLVFWAFNQKRTFRSPSLLAREIKFVHITLVFRVKMAEFNPKNV
jgi:hypothetical protein